MLKFARSWLQLPEALTAFLIPLPFIFASIAYPTLLGQPRKLPSTLSEAVAESAPAVETPAVPSESQLLHALTLSSATLLLVGLIAKASSTLQLLDKRKPDKSLRTFNLSAVPKRVTYNVLSVLLPFYASMQLGGAKVGLVLLTAAAAGLGALDPKPGKNTPWDDLRRTLRTRKATCGAILLAIIADTATSPNTSRPFPGYTSLLTSVFLVPPPLPTAGWSLIMGSQGQTNYVTQESSRASLPKPSSPLINSFESTLLTLVSGLVLTVFTIIYSLIHSSSPPLTKHAIGYSTLSIASTAALIYFSLPTALRSQKNVGLALGSVFVAAVHSWEQYSTSGFLWISFGFTCAGLVGAVIFDTQPSKVTGHLHSHGHSHSHSGHNHDHNHDHHLHGNHSRLSAFIIRRTTPGSILHSILIEKDSRRIAYFGV